MDKARKAEIIEAYKLHDGDTGSPEVQIAILILRFIKRTSTQDAACL